MKILVTGANGFLAGYIIRNLILKGEDVYGMMRPNADTRNLADLQFVPVYGKITSTRDVDNATQDMDVIVHTAAVTSQTASDRDYYNINVLASHYILHAALKNNVKRLIYISSANTIGYGDGVTTGTEESEIASDFKRLGYARSKWMAERLLLRAYRQGGIDIIILNPSFMIGYDATAGSSSQIFSFFLKHNPLLLPGGGKNFIYVDDVAKAVCSAVYDGKNGHRYLLANENLSYMEFFKRVESLSGVSKKIIPIPDPVLYLAGIGGSIVNLMGFHLPLTKHNAKVLSIRSFYNASKAINELGLRQTDINVGISEALRSFPV